MNQPKMDYYTISEDNYGNFTVFGWDTFPTHSVLAGQPRKNFIDQYDRAEEAQEEYPDADFSNEWIDPQISFTHLH